MIIFQRSDGIHSKTSKLTEAQVRRIRSEYDRGKRGKDRAAKFGVTPTTYNAIGRRATWKGLK